jgi:hypothetical protein
MEGGTRPMRQHHMHRRSDTVALIITFMRPLHFFHEVAFYIWMKCSRMPDASTRKDGAVLTVGGHAEPSPSPSRSHIPHPPRAFLESRSAAHAFHELSCTCKHHPTKDIR